MIKNSFTFAHDYGARNDPKIQDILFNCGEGGAGGFCWWVIVEMLYEQGGYLPRKYYQQIAYAAHCGIDTVRYVVEESGLFKFDDEKIWSEKVLWQLGEREKKSEAAKKSINARWTKYKEDKQNKEVIENQTDSSDCITNEIESNYETDTNVIRSYNGRNTKREDKINEDKLSEDKLSNNEDANASLSAEKNSADPEDAPEEQIFADFGSEASTDEEKQQVNFDSENSDEQQDNSVNPNEKVLTPKECQKVSDYWNREVDRTGANVAKVAAMSEPRQNKIRIRWKEFAKVGPANDVFREIVRQVCGSKFLQGDNNRGWKCTFDWIFENGKNWVKVYEGNYANQQQDGNSQAGRRQQMTQQDELNDLQMHPNKYYRESVDVEIDDEAKAVIESLNKRE